jgi:hypothetical protein
MAEARTAAGWPVLEWNDWKDTMAGLHMATQIVGKTRLALTPRQNHWWNVPLYVNPRGLTTSGIPYRGGELEIQFDFERHLVELRMSRGKWAVVRLNARPVAEFFAEYMWALEGLGVDANIWPMPVEVAQPVRFDRDTAMRPYDESAVEQLHRVLMRVDRALKQFATGFQGKISPVHFFWGSFDLCCTRFSGRRAGGPPKSDPVQQEAYSHEVISAGWWPGNGGYGAAAFYCYAAPVPEGLAARQVRPGAWDAALGEFILTSSDVCGSTDPDAALMSFLETTYAAGAEAAGWDRQALDRPVATAPNASPSRAR